MRPLSSPFVSQLGWRSAQTRGGARLLVAVHLLVITSLLFSTAAAAMPLSKPGSRAVDATQRTLARTRASATDTNQPQPILTLAATVNPEAAAIGERVLLRWEVMNLDRQDVTLTYDAENRLTAMSGSVASSYVYDADGSRVQETIAGVTRVFISSYYEVDNGTVKKYYYAGAVRVAENSGGILYYLLGDHLGSTALTLDSSGNRTTELRYYPYGAARYNPGSQVTTYRFTGQRWDSGMALYFYQSRWYDPVIGRFLAADTLVPRPEDPQNLNRYSYCGSNPLRFVDPSGHAGVDFWGGGGGAGIGLAVALMQGAQQTMTQVQGAIYQYGPVAAQNTWLYGNQTIAVGDQISQAVQNAGQGGNTTGPGGLDPNDPRFKKATEQAAQTQRNAVTSSGLNAFSRAADFGIRSYNQLRGVTSGTGLQAHHLIEERFAKGLGLDAGKIPSIALTPQEHQVFTNAWRNAIGYLGDRNPLNTGNASLADIWAAAQRVYVDYPELLRAVQQALFGQ